MIVVVSAHSCGVTVSSLALALASPWPTLLAEADCRFGAVRAGLRQGMPGGEVGLGHLGRALREGQLAEAFGAFLQPLATDGTRAWLPGLTDPLQAADLEHIWEPLAGLLREAEAQGRQVIVDGGRLAFTAGRLDPVHCPALLIYQADMVVVAVRNTPTSLAQTRPAVRALREDLAAAGGHDVVRLLLIEEGQLQSHDVSRALDTAHQTGPPVVGALPWDERAAQVLTHGAQRPNLPKSRLLPRAREAARAIRSEMQALTLRQPRMPDQPPATLHAPAPAPTPEAPYA
jgi:hypothetical protein